MSEPITAATFVPLVNKVASELAGPAKGIAGRAKEKLEVKFRKGFQSYVEKQLIRASTVKTIISSSAPIPLQIFM